MADRYYVKGDGHYWSVYDREHPSNPDGWDFSVASFVHPDAKQWATELVERLEKA